LAHSDPRSEDRVRHNGRREEPEEEWEDAIEGD
jgi:hypothetical protein